MTDAATAHDQVIRIPIDLIAAGAFQARRHFAQAALAELAASIAESGVIQPIVVRGNHTDGFTLLAGERRWRAAARVGVHQLPAIVRNDLSDEQAAVLGLIENLQRESLGVVDTARGLQRLCQSHQLTHDAVAERIGKSRAHVTNYLRILQLPEPIQQLLDDKQLSLGHAKALIGADPAVQAMLAQRAASQGLSVRALERLARDSRQSRRKPTAAATHDPDIAALEQRLSAYFGNTTRIRYAADQRRGQLSIDFHDLDEFDGLLARLGVDLND